MESALDATFAVRCPCGKLYTFPVSSLPRKGPPTPILCNECGRLFTWSEADSKDASENAYCAVAMAREERLRERPPKKFNWRLTYWIGYWIFFVPIFFGCWIYCVATSGFIIGVLIGWLPSAIVAAIVSFFWPLILLGVVLVLEYYR